MKALWITDLHLRPGRHEAGARLLAFILKIAKERAPEIIVCTGDVFHDKNFLYATSLDLFRDFLVQAGKFVDQIYLAPGNHDYGTEYSVHSLTGYKGIPRVTVVDTVAKITEDVGIVSYARQEARFNQLMHELGPVKFLFGHFDLNGFDLGSGWEEKESWSDPEIFKKIPTLSKVFSGHYHLAQSKIVNDITFTYLGTGATTDFGESDQIKRIGLVDLSTGVLEEIQTGLTLHKTLRINAGEDFPDIPTAETEAGVEYRLIIRGTQQQIDLIKKPKDYPARISYDFITEVSERLDVSASDKKEDVLLKYVNFEIKKASAATASNALTPEKIIDIGSRYLSRYRGHK